MPRHGTAIAEAASPPEPVPAPSSRPVARSRGLSGWPIRRKLAALVAPPLVIILAAGALLGYSAFGNLQDARRAQAISQAIVLSGEATLALQEEINQAIVGASIGAGGSGPDKNSIARLDTLIAKTDDARAALQTSLESPPSGGWSADATLAGKEIQDSAGDLAQARKDAKSNRNYSFADTAYQRALRVHLGLTNSLARDLTTATADGRLAAAATTISAMSGLADAASSERTEGAVLLAKAPVVPGDKISAQSLGNYLTYIQTQAIQASIAQRFATANAVELLNTAQSTDADTIERFRRDIVNLSTAIDPREDFRVGKAIEFSEVAGQRVQRIDNALTRMADDTNAIAEDVARAALLRTALVIGIALAMLVIGILLAAAISKTVTVPLRRLRSAAVEAATVRLPAAVRQIERQGPDAVPALPPVLPPGTAAGPETLEVAAAVDGLTTEALRLATAQVRLRQAIDEAFVSMSRRSQSMVEKQLSIIDELESTEEDPDQLRNLFRLDHLAARMRRYNDNLLVLAGSTVRTRSAAPVPVADIFRAATSEMEQYERVRLQPISGTAIAGPAAGGLIHLLAELLDNAAMYSPPTSPILLTAQFMPDGGLHLEVTDSGVGIPPTELAELNARLNTPGTLDAQVPSRMGLFVVARLAQRGGLRVRLSPRANAAGTVAEVIVPPALVAGGPAGESQPSSFGDIPAAPAGPAGPGVVGPAGNNGFGGLSPAASPFPVPSPSSEPARPAPAEPAAAAGAKG
ncbi:ATP-binding protein, partial [Kineosporia sp. A_224]|uniref:sensor histidine kinase n=1 Tax=Kineosporia sp. A_224 TaxID=1962180 RepID=UPI00117A224F